MSAVAGFVIAGGLLAAVNLGRLWLPGWSYLPVNAAMLLALLFIARASGTTASDLGIERGRLRPGLARGLAIGLLLAAGVALAAGIPATRELFDDQRAAGIGIGGLLYQASFRIPLGTALFEEAAFRGVLLGLGRRAWGTRIGTWSSALLFGFWHVVPALETAGGNRAADALPAGIVVAGAVAVTAAAGLVFSWLRDRTGSLATPVVVHALVNAAAFTAAWAVG